MSIIGYSFQADVWCEDCARELGIRQALKLGSATIWGDAGTAEQALGEWASLEGISRMDERSYDSGDFPKVILSSMVDGHEHCGQCRECMNHDPEDCGRLTKGVWKW